VGVLLWGCTTSIILTDLPREFAEKMLTAAAESLSR
jgi:hypothetical protein